MSLGPWRYAFTSTIGTSHTLNSLRCQDSSMCQVFEAQGGEQVLVAVASDGAGSAARSDEGSALACEITLAELSAHFQRGGGVNDVSQELVAQILVRLKVEIEDRGAAACLPAREYASTLIAAVVGEKSAVFFQIGDGAIVVSALDEPEAYHWVFWPQQGEYANQTNFATEPRAPELVEVTTVNRTVNEVALFTDGLQMLVLNFRNQTAHGPFFEYAFRQLHAEGEGFSARVSSAISSLLDSQAVTDRTDDDKTLIIASRRAGDGPDLHGDDVL
jgi:hypothetical protein